LGKIWPVFWIGHRGLSLVIKELFTSELSNQVVFNGGTSLSKCHNLIQRSPEDIHLVIFRTDVEADSQLTIRLKKVGKIVPPDILRYHNSNLYN